MVMSAAAAPDDLFTITALVEEVEGVKTGRRRGAPPDIQALRAGPGAVKDPANEVTVSKGELASVTELDFAFRRAASRLVEMSSTDYLRRWHAASA